MIRTTAIVLVLWCWITGLTGCALGSFEGGSDVSPVGGTEAGSALRTVQGTIFRAGPSAMVRADGNRGEIATISGLIRVPGARVFAACNPSRVALTDANGRFSLIVDLDCFYSWREEQQIPSLDASGQALVASSTEETPVPILVEVDVESSAGIQRQSIFIPVSFGSEVLVNLDQHLPGFDGSGLLLKPSGRLDGVCRLDGAPVASVGIFLYDANTGSIAYVARSGSEGRLSLEVAPGSYRIVAFRPGVQPFVVQRTIGDGQNLSVEFELSSIVVEPGKIFGHVVNEVSGAPVDGALVVLAGTAFQTITDREGFFQFTQIPAGTYSLVVMRDEFQVKSFPRVIVP